MFKSNKGFTLVELIVVIAILAILAGVAIPVYNGYIKRANDAAVVTELDGIMTAAQAANATQGQIVKVVLEDDGKTVKVAGKDNILASDFDENFVLFQGGAQDAAANSVGVFTLNKAINIANTSYKDGATWTVESGKWEADADDVDAQTTPGADNGGEGTGNEGTGNEGTGNEGTGNEGTGNEGTGNEGTGNEGTGGEYNPGENGTPMG